MTVLFSKIFCPDYKIDRNCHITNICDKTKYVGSASNKYKKTGNNIFNYLLNLFIPVRFIDNWFYWMFESNVFSIKQPIILFIENTFNSNFEWYNSKSGLDSIPSLFCTSWGICLAIPLPNYWKWINKFLSTLIFQRKWKSAKNIFIFKDIEGVQITPISILNHISKIFESKTTFF